MLKALKYSFFYLLPVFVNAETDYEQLPNCVENSVPGLVLVSTIDGKVSALNSEGALEWQIDTEPGPLLTSNIHSLELTNSGKWIRIIPSLTGSLYRFDGSSLDPISITADSLLRSSFKYSEDLVIAGGLEVRTYGVGFRTGKLYYTCSSLNCINNTNNGNEMDNILLIERTTQIVRAVESRSGYERWNFSVGTHNLKLSQISCTNPQLDLFNWNISAIIPDGLLLASKNENNVKTSWQYHFPSPIVRVWKWNGAKLSEIDLFQVKNDQNSVQSSPAIYLGMHKKQLYIHESFYLQNQMQRGIALAETGLAKIPWRPVPASGVVTEDDSTAISVLYSSEYVNGNGYYLYSDRDVKQRTGGLCEHNGTLKFPALTHSIGAASFGNFLSSWWKEIIVSMITTAALFNVIFRQFTRRQNKNKFIFVERHVEVPILKTPLNDASIEFNSRYLNDFDTLQCLGKGGFGVVFEVKQKIDECHYAIKRIILPSEESKRDAVMREVKALAKLEHHNIVRYFNSWVEKPPFGWEQQYDSTWIKDTNEFTEYTTTNANKSSTVAGTGCTKSLYEESCGDSFIVFNDSNEGSQLLQTNNDTNKEDLTSLEKTQSIGVNWRRPGRRYHSINPENPPAFLYIQMQLCQKHSLKEWLIEHKTRDYSYIIHIFKQILSAVEYFHLQGLIHRDLKPSNIFFSLDGQIKIGDFGLVKDEEESHDSIHSTSPQRGHTKEVGTRLYMSPEQLNGCKYNYKVDIYSLGLIFFELLVYFGTDMERIKTITDIRDHKFPKQFIEQYSEEHNLLKLMLCEKPENRLTTFGVRARPPLNCCDTDYNMVYDFELPKSPKLTGVANSNNSN